MKYKNPSATVDLIVKDESNRILLIKRKHKPFKNCWALPGGYLECGKETLEEAGVRELKEETNIDINPQDLMLIGNYSSPNRDPRGHVISHAYFVRKYSGTPKAGDDAAEFGFFYEKEFPELAFDHRKIIGDFLKLKLGRE
ncbi:MAG: NUDIX hydrolase [archaeon]|nr:NUDIX hydrolase [archaeon]